MHVPGLEKQIGIEVYASRSPGIGGRIRQRPEDFIVEEILRDGSKAEVSSAEVKRPVGRGRYLICVMVKRDWDTILAIGTLARHLGISRDRIEIAGIKDAKALTAQHISISRMMSEQILGVQIKDITLRPLRFSDQKLYSGFLRGNAFHILVRAVQCEYSVVEQRVEAVQNELSVLGGVPNFFGHQRFGTIRPVTHQVGRFITRGNWERAALTFLADSSPSEHPEAREARKQLSDTRDFEVAFRCFPKNLKYERSMLRHLARRPKDFVGAFRRLPKKLRKLFVQAYQSYLFNRFLSERFRRLSLTEIYVGDYVANLGQHGLVTREFQQVDSHSLPRIKKALATQEVRVSLPLVGFKQGTSGGLQGEIETEILEAENVKPQDFSVGAMREMSAAGDLRPALASVIDPSVDAVSSDPMNPSKQRIRVSFTLYRGSYATVVLRELMKPSDLIEAGF